MPLQAGTYWLSVVPECTNTNDYNCNYATYYETGVEDDPPLHHYGPLEPSDDSFLTATRGEAVNRCLEYVVAPQTARGSRMVS